MTTDEQPRLALTKDQAEAAYDAQRNLHPFGGCLSLLSFPSSTPGSKSAAVREGYRRNVSVYAGDKEVEEYTDWSDFARTYNLRARGANSRARQ